MQENLFLYIKVTVKGITGSVPVGYRCGRAKKRLSLGVQWNEKLASTKILKPQCVHESH